MAKDMEQPPMVEELSDKEIERIEATLFCCGGPPARLTAALAARAAGLKETRKRG